MFPPNADGTGHDVALQDRSRARDCSEGVLDAFAACGVCCVQTGRSAYRAAGSTTYPLKEGFFWALDESWSGSQHKRTLLAGPGLHSTFTD